MTRLTPAQRKATPISAAAWKVVTGETPIQASDGTLQPATKLIYSWLRTWLENKCKRPINWRGTPLQPDFEWISYRTFAGRSMRDVAEELEGEALEAAASAVDDHSPERGPLIAYMKRRLESRLAAEFERWATTSTSTNQYREDHGSIEMLAEGEEKHQFMASPETFDTLESDSVDKELAATALAALNPVEAKALELYSQGESYSEIARIIEVADHSNARRIVKRATQKAREALIGAEEE